MKAGKQYKLIKGNGSQKKKQKESAQ